MTTPAHATSAALCHSLVLRLPGAPELDSLRRTLGSVRVWQTSVPVGADDPLAQERRRAESFRPIHRNSPPCRVVVLRYADETVELVLVALRAALSADRLHHLARLLLGLPTQAVPLLPSSTPSHPGFAACDGLDWGLGDPALHGVLGSVQFELTGSGEKAAELLIPAIALAVSRYGDRDRVELGVLDLGDAAGEQLRAFVVDERRTDSSESFLRQFGQAPVIAQQPPPVGVVLSPAFDEGNYTACLAPIFALTIQLARGTSRAVCQFDRGVVDAAVAQRFCAHVAQLAGQLAEAAAARPLAELELLSRAERVALLQAGGAGTAAPARGRIDRAFEAVAARQPNAVALLAGNDQLTYQQLDDRADAVAAGLRALRVAAGSRVGVCLDRDAELVVTLLGVLKAGCAYVPMDPRYPARRLEFTVQNAGMPVVVTRESEFPDIAGVRLVSPEDLAELGAGQPVAGGRTAEHDTDPAYVIYTSGSTGTPKGVVVPHRNVLALLSATAADFSLGSDDTWTLFHSSAFDFSVWEIWGCLLTGGRLVVVPFWTTRDTEEFHAMLVQRGVTVLSQTPSAFAQLIAADQRLGGHLSLRLVIFGGEPLDVRMLGPWFARHSATDCRVVNMYGITETTVHVTAQTVTPREVVTGSRSVGHPLPGWSVSVRDEQGRVLPPGPSGEIYVGGAGVASHYLDQPELTEQRFLQDEETGERVYRSGDKGRLRPDGRLDHLGRLDNQVKVRGHRIELDEIRSVLLAAPRVSAAAVVVNRDQPADPASSRIDAYLVLETDGEAAAVLAHARAILPDYMVPATITEVTEIALTINGKPDLKALPVPHRGLRPAGDTAKQPAATDAGQPVASKLADDILDIWSAFLKTPVSLQDNFFTQGGNSLLVVRVLAEMRERKLPRVSLKQFYGHSTAAQFVELVEGLSEASR